MSNTWLSKVLEWGQAAIDEVPVEINDPDGSRERLFVAVAESLGAKEHNPKVKPVDIANHAPLICVPLSGGLDSVVAYEVAKRTKNAEVRAFYVKLNTPYAQAELEALDKLGIEYSVINLSRWPQNWRPYAGEWKHILPMRNMAIVMAIAEQTEDRPAEIWLGATDGEIPLTGGDKSLRFFDAMDTVLECLPVKHSIKFPLAKMTKTDLVKWWLRVGLSVERLRVTLTCQAPLRNGNGWVIHCGRCHACFNRWVALTNNGLTEAMGDDPRQQYSNEIKVSEMKRALDERDFVNWSEKRILQTLQAWERTRTERVEAQSQLSR